MITELMNDEISHKEESLINVSKLSFVHKIWGLIVTAGSKLAVGVSKNLREYFNFYTSLMARTVVINV